MQQESLFCKLNKNKSTHKTHQPERSRKTSGGWQKLGIVLGRRRRDAVDGLHEGLDHGEDARRENGLCG